MSKHVRIAKDCKASRPDIPSGDDISRYPCSSPMTLFHFGAAFVTMGTNVYNLGRHCLMGLRKLVVVLFIGVVLTLAACGGEGASDGSRKGTAEKKP